MGNEGALGVDGICIARGADPCPVDRVLDVYQVDVGLDDALPGRALGDGDRHVSPPVALTEDDVPEVCLAGPRDDERGSL